MIDPCIVCGKTVYDLTHHRAVGKDEWYLCSQRCASEFDRTYKSIQARLDEAIRKVEDDPRQGLPLDEQWGWKVKRWWNQTYKHRQAAREQAKIEREFKRIQRKARRNV